MFGSDPFDDSTNKSGPLGQDLLVKLRNSKLKYPFIVFAANAFFLPILLLAQCFGLIVLPLAILLFLYVMKVQNFWHQLLIGMITILIAVLLSAAALVPTVTTEADLEIESFDGTLVDGSLTPFRGDRSTLYNYSITVVNDNVTSVIFSYVNIGELKGISIEDRNESMPDCFWNEDNTRVTYYLLTHANGTINLFSFSVSVNGVWYEAGNLNDGTVFAVQGPIDESTLAVLGYLSIYMFFTVMQLAFPVFLILLLFLRFMYKSQEAKRKMLESYRKKKSEDDGKGGSDMGDPERSRRLSAFGDGSDEMFVCSECGADVPATAKFCPNCGESFEDEEPEIDIGDDRLRGRG